MIGNQMKKEIEDLQDPKIAESSTSIEGLIRDMFVPSFYLLHLFVSCGGESYRGSTCCVSGLKCELKDEQ